MDTRARILLAAREIHMNTGEAGLSMRKLGDHLGLSAAALYRHFRDKEHLLTELRVEGFERLAAHVMRGMMEKTPRQRLQRMMREYVDFAIEHPRDYRMMCMSPLPSSPLLRERLHQASSPTLQMLVDRVFECQRDGLLSQDLDARHIALSTRAHLHGVLSLWLDDQLDDTLQSPQQLREFIERYHTHPLASLRP